MHTPHSPNSATELGLFYKENMNIQFYHGTKNKTGDREFTLAALVPKSQYFDNVLYEFRAGKNEFKLTFGISVVNQEDGDNYVRKTGRQVSTEKMLEQAINVKHITVSKNGTTSFFLTNNKYTLIFEQRRGKDKAYLVAAFKE